MRTLTKSLSHIESVRSANGSVMEHIQELLGISHEDFCMHQFQQYEGFLESEFIKHPHLKNIVRYSPVFRGFFCDEWIKRNERQFLPFAAGLEPDDFDIREEYLYLNSAEYLLNDPYFIQLYERVIDVILKDDWKICQRRK